MTAEPATRGVEFMSRDPNDVVKVFAGTLIDVESNKELLAELGIQSNVVGSDLSSSFGSALPGSVELWVHCSDAEKATAAIKRDEAGNRNAHGGKHPHPHDDPKPGSPPVRKEPYVNPNPGG
jgi:hypothetical protein